MAPPLDPDVPDLPAWRGTPTGPGASPPSVGPWARRARLLRGLVVAAALFGALVGALQLLWHARLFAARAPFPLDLEWMEGGMLLHAQRLARGETVYAPPTLDFIPFLYTPLYPALVGLLSKLFGLSYLLGRLVSIAAFAGALALLVAAAARRAAGGADVVVRPRARLVALSLGLAGAGVVAGGFEFAGAFYDLVRADALLLLLQALALFLAYERTSRSSAAAAGLVIALAFFTKQTASVVGLAIGLGLLISDWRRGLIYGLVAAPLLVLGLWLLNATSDGWFWRYVFELHQSHTFDWARAVVETPARIVAFTTPLLAALVIGAAALAFGRQIERRDALLGLTAAAGFAAACIGFGTQWAFENAYIPAIYFPAYAATVFGARLAVHAAAALRGPTIACAAACALALGAQSVRAGRPAFDARRPGDADHRAARAFLDKLRALPGELFIPFHPYYAVLVGKRPFVHRMGVWDVAAQIGRPAGLDEAIAGQRFGHVVLDWKSRPGEWPHLDRRYRVAHEFRDGVDAVRMFSGAETSPRWLLVPIASGPPLPPGGVAIADFESGTFDGWSAEGVAFGGAPSPASEGLSGRYAAASGGATGGQATGVLRSPPWTVDRPRLRFLLKGPRDRDLRVLLLAGPEVARSASPEGAARLVEWDVSDLVGREVSVVVEDRSTRGAIALDDLVAH